MALAKTRFFLFNSCVAVFYFPYLCTYIVCIVQLAMYESNQNISQDQVVGVESINIDYVAFLVLNIGCSPVLRHTVCHLFLGATVMQETARPFPVTRFSRRSSAHPDQTLNTNLNYFN